MLRLSRAKLTELETFLLVQSDTYSSGVNSSVPSASVFDST